MASAAKRATQQAEDERRETELKSLEKQGQMMRTTRPDGASLWSKAVHHQLIQNLVYEEQIELMNYLCTCKTIMYLVSYLLFLLSFVVIVLCSTVVTYLDICIGLCHPLIVPCMWNPMKVL